MTAGEGEEGENLKNEVEEEQGENVRWNEESVEKRKKRKRKLKHKELAIGKTVQRFRQQNPYIYKNITFYLTAAIYLPMSL